MKLVFAILINNLFTSHHSFTFSSSEFIKGPSYQVYAKFPTPKLLTYNSLVKEIRNIDIGKVYSIEYNSLLL